jgi:AIG2 family protein|nr:MAG TPA: hypothetical protein [Caudoviricetes sp.]
MKQRYYLAYGSNLNIRQMAYRCPTARIVGTATIQDYQLFFKGSKNGSYLTIEPQAGSCVPVAVWAVQASDERRLDSYEGFPSFYYKKELRLPITGIKTGKVRTRDAFVYIMHEDRPLGIPTAQYLNVCHEGYTHFGFDSNLLLDAYMRSAEVCK